MAVELEGESTINRHEARFTAPRDRRSVCRAGGPGGPHHPPSHTPPHPPPPPPCGIASCDFQITTFTRTWKAFWEALPPAQSERQPLTEDSDG